MLPTRNYSATDTAITQRPTSTALFCIDSEDRFDNYSEGRSNIPFTNADPYDFIINRNESLVNGFFTRVGLTEIVFPWVIPNINARTSTVKIRFTIGGVVQPDEEIVVPIGFYTPSQLAAAVQTQVRNADPSLVAFTCVYGYLNQPLFYYATNTAETIGFIPMTPNSADYEFGPNSKQLFDVLGFSAANATLLTDRYGGPTYCQSIRYIDIVCTQLTYNQALKDTMSQPVARDSLCRVYISDVNNQSTVSPSSSTFCPPGCAPTTIYRNFATPKQIQWLPNQPIVGALRFQVYDDSGELLSLTDTYTGLGTSLNKTNWSMTLLITEN